MPAGVLAGGVLGALIGKLVVYLRSRHQESLGLDEFLALGLMALAYGVAVMAEANGFLAVLAAGMALQRVKERSVASAPGRVGLQPQARLLEEAADDPAQASAYMMQGVRNFNEQLERIAEVTVVLVVGAMLSFISFDPGVLLFVVVLFLLVRPLSVWLGMLGTQTAVDQRRLIGWFGIRGIGSVYYLMFAISHGLPSPLAEQFIAITLTVVTASVVLHGISVTPLMALYARRKARIRVRKQRRLQARSEVKPK